MNNAAVLLCCACLGVAYATPGQVIAGEPGTDSTPLICDARDDYAPRSCRGTRHIYTLDDYELYRHDLSGNAAIYEHLHVMASLAAPLINLQSPCTISVARGVTLQAEQITLDGLHGVSTQPGVSLHGGAVCLASALGSVQLGGRAQVRVQSLFVLAHQDANTGSYTSIEASGNATLLSTGTRERSAVLVDSGASITARNLWLQAERSAHVGHGARVSVDETLTIFSTGEWSDSNAGVRANASVQAGTSIIAASHNTGVHSNASLDTNYLQIVSSGRYGTNATVIDRGANVDVSGDAKLESAAGMVIAPNATMVSTGRLSADAGSSQECHVAESANVGASTTAGNCL